MKVYLVGGAVRDGLLGIKGSDKDYVVVGATSEDMFKKGFRKVGKQFPVFIHPKTREEYALARKEIKVEAGHQGFEFVFDPGITLEEDLLRRDFTVNAMAMDEKGNVIDPYGGLSDLKSKKLRHVSKHFDEDPLRVIRGCRFSATLGFEIADETLKLMKKVSKGRELDTLSSERLWMELTKVFKYHAVRRFVYSLEKVGALEVILPSFQFKDFKKKSSSIDFKKFTDIEQFSLLYFFIDNKDLYLKTFSIPNKFKKLAKQFDDFSKELKAEDFYENAKKVLGLFKRIRFDDVSLSSLAKIAFYLFGDQKAEKLLDVLRDLKRVKLRKELSPEEILSLQVAEVASSLKHL